MKIKELCKEAHRIAVEKGFWLKKDGVLEPRNTSELLMLIVSELGEACEALRKDLKQPLGETEAIVYKKNVVKINPKLKKVWLKDTFEDEIADVFIRLGDLCEAMGIDIEWQIKQKMKYNKTRPMKHGKKF